jgi:hypothetical protein
MSCVVLCGSVAPRKVYLAVPNVGESLWGDEEVDRKIKACSNDHRS